MAGSIAFATDLVARRAEGGVVEPADGYRIVRTPANPAFRWGNFLLADAGAELREPDVWAQRHRDAFPELDFVAVGVDDADALLDDPAWIAAGFEVERLPVLRAPADRVRSRERDVQEVRGDDDWDDVLGIALDEGSDEPGYADFERRRVAAERAACEAGSALWLGVREGGRIVGALGVLPAPGGVARYQSVGTLAAFRRRGIAGRLLRAGAAAADDRWRCTGLVIVADADGPAIGLYRRLGFEEAETQLQLTRMPAS
jgi:ribosomal protein S18 acetylase RimI-like enzyme